MKMICLEIIQLIRVYCRKKKASKNFKLPKIQPPPQNTNIFMYILPDGFPWEHVCMSYKNGILLCIFWK